MNIDEIQKFFSLLDKGGVIVVLFILIYYGKKFVERIIEIHNKHITEIIQEYKKIQEETNQINKESIRALAKHNDMAPQIQEMYELIKYDKTL